MAQVKLTDRQIELISALIVNQINRYGSIITNDVCSSEVIASIRQNQNELRELLEKVNE